MYFGKEGIYWLELRESGNTRFLDGHIVVLAWDIIVDEYASCMHYSNVIFVVQPKQSNFTKYSDKVSTVLLAIELCLRFEQNSHWHFLPLPRLVAWLRTSPKEV